MTSTGLSSYANSILVVPVLDLLDFEHFAPWIHQAATETTDRLLVFLVSSHFRSGNNGNRIEDWKDLEKLLSFVYVRASRVAINLDRVLMRIDVVLHALQGPTLSGVDRLKSIEWNTVFTPTGVQFTSLPDWISAVPRQWLQDAASGMPHAASLPTGSEDYIRRPVVALGGTFDHLHAGHKILLSMAAWIASEKVIVGVTDDTLLTKKSNRELVETIEHRIEAVRDFLSLFRPQIMHEIVPISDVYGPTATDSNIQALVVSKETVSGAVAIAKLREERSLPGLETYVIDVIAGDSGADLAAEEDAEYLKTAKMSSTYIREWMAQRGMK